MDQVVPPTGRKIDSEQVHVLGLRDGQVIRHEAVRDEVTMLGQLGVFPPTPATGIRMLVWRTTGRAARAAAEVTTKAARAAATTSRVRTMCWFGPPTCRSLPTTPDHRSDAAQLTLGEREAPDTERPRVLVDRGVKTDVSQEMTPAIRTLTTLGGDPFQAPANWNQVDDQKKEWTRSKPLPSSP